MRKVTKLALFVVFCHLSYQAPASTSLRLTLRGYEQQTTIPNNYSIQVAVSFTTTDADSMAWHSPDNSQSGSLAGVIYSYNYSSQPTFPNVQTFVSDSGPWTLDVTKGGTQSAYTFTIDTSGLSQSQFGTVTILRPQTNQTYTYPNGPSFQWTAPTAPLAKIGGAYINSTDSSYQFSAMVDPAAMSTLVPRLSPGQYFFELYFNGSSAPTVPVTFTHISGPDVLSIPATSPVSYSFEDWTQFSVTPEPVIAPLFAAGVIVTAARRRTRSR